MIGYQDRTPAALAAEGRWPELLALYRRTRAAASARRGEPAAVIGTGALGQLIAYGAPPELATRLFDRDDGPGSAAGVGDHDTGPLWEVLATRHSWRRLAPLLEPAPVRLLVAHTRVLLGEELGDDVEPDPDGIPLEPARWETSGCEPASLVREYLPGGGARRALFSVPADREGLGPVELPTPGATLAGQPATGLLERLAPWARAACVRGAAPDAAAQLAPPGRVTGGYVGFAAVFPALVHASSAEPSAGAAQGRIAVWRLLAAMAGEARPSVTEVGALVGRARCFVWCEPTDELHYLHLAVEDPASGLAWAIGGHGPL